MINKNIFTESDTPRRYCIEHGICPSCGGELKYNRYTNVTLYDADLRYIRAAYNCVDCDSAYTIRYQAVSIMSTTIDDLNLTK